MVRAHDRIRRLLEIGRLTEALSALSTALASEPDDIVLNGLLAQALLGVGDNAAALSAANRMAALAPDDAWAQRLRSIALGHLDRDDEAHAAALEGVRLAPHAWESHVCHAGAASVLRGHRREGVAAAQRAVSLAPHRPETHFALGVALIERRDVRRARAAFRRTLQLDPGHSEARNNLAILGSGLLLRRETTGVLAALRADPQSEAPAWNLDRLLPQVLVRVCMALEAALIAALVVTAHVSPRHSEPRAGSYVLLAGAVVALGGYVGSYLRHLPHGVLGDLWQRNRSRFRLWWTLVPTILTALAVILVCVVPGGGIVGIWTALVVYVWIVLNGHGLPRRRFRQM